jgi:uncharacterized membrane protein YedE/YeeE
MTATTEQQRPQAYMNPYLAGIGLGLVLLSAFVLVGRGLGASGAFNSVVAWGVNAVAPEHAKHNEFIAGYLGDGASSPLKSWLLFEMVGAVAGAMFSGLLAGRARLVIEKGPRVSDRVRLLMAFLGGALMAVGAALARGCTSGQGLTGGSLLNLGSWVAMIMIFAGAYALAYFVRWQWR